MLSFLMTCCTACVLPVHIPGNFTAQYGLASLNALAFFAYSWLTFARFLLNFAIGLHLCFTVGSRRQVSPWHVACLQLDVLKIVFVGYIQLK